MEPTSPGFTHDTCSTFRIEDVSVGEKLAEYYLKNPRIRALFAGNAAHSMLPLEYTAWAYCRVPTGLTADMTYAD